MSNKEAQEEELEVLKSIYEGDTEFKSVDDHTFQYKFGSEGEKSAVLIEVQWPEDYPEAVPKFSLGAFYNNHLSSSAKSALLTALNEEAEKNVGCQQTYTLIDWAKENLESVIGPYLAEDAAPGLDTLSLESKDDNTTEFEEGKPKVKKEQLTKSQKRKEWDRVDNKGERPRGYDWVDVVRHLSQTGPERLDFSTPVSSSHNNYLHAADLPS